jgi:hypothetical protein
MINTTISSFFGKKREIKEQSKSAEQSDDEVVKIVATKKPNKRKQAKVE